MLGDKESAAEGDLTIFEDRLIDKWNLNESQFKTYASIVIERLTGLLSDTTGKSTGYNSRFELLNKQFQYKTEQWQTINNIKSYIIPELLGSLQTNSISPSPFEFSKRIGNEDYLISAVTIPGQNQQDNTGILGIKLNNLNLQNSILNNAFEEIQPLKNTTLYNSAARV